MSDELFDRDYQATRSSLNDGIEQLLLRLGQSVVTALRVLNRRQWAAPWRPRTSCR